MINSVNKIPIYELLSSDSPHYYKIPKYQRAYTWSPHEWEALYDDIGENDSGYFMGSIICISPKNENIFEVIDGQQRITTLCLFLNYHRFFSMSTNFLIIIPRHLQFCE